jgi:hypothetical protein
MCPFVEGKRQLRINTKFWLENLRENGKLEDLGVDGIIILK